MASWITYLEFILYIGLLFFFVPIKYKGNDELDYKFQKYLENFNKSFENSTDYQRGFAAFKYSLQTIEALNSNKTNETAFYGLTKFSDMSPTDFAKLYLQPDLGRRIIKHNLADSKEVNSDESHIRTKRYKLALKDKVDWREQHVITEIKNQGSCGACWAFSTIEVIESMQAIQNGTLEELSVQQMIDCAGNKNNGCRGGDTCSLLSWLKDNRVKIQTEKKYPWTDSQNQCSMKHTNQTTVQVANFACQSFVSVEEIMLDLLDRHGPLTVAVNAQNWQYYLGGVIQYHCSENPMLLNHAVQLVGYNLNASVPYYIARNTWGKDFGNNGYLYLAIGKNICGLAHHVGVVKVL